MHGVARSLVFQVMLEHGHQPAVAAQPRFQVQPQFINNCDPTVPQSSHPSGILVGLGDGSVRFARNSIDPVTWMWMGPANDGIVVNIP